MPKQAFGECAVETFHNSLVSVNFRAPAANICFVVFHLFGHTPHELAPRVNLQHLLPRQRAAPGDTDTDNGLRAFVNFAAVEKFVMRQKK